MNTKKCSSQRQSGRDDWKEGQAEQKSVGSRESCERIEGRLVPLDAQGRPLWRRKGGGKL